MTAQQWFNTNQGKAILVPDGGEGNGGQCFQIWDSFHHDVLGHPYIYTPGAIDLSNKFVLLGLQAYYLLFQNPPQSFQLYPNDSVVYDARIGSKYGHVDVVSRTGGIVSDHYAYDSNWGNVKNDQGLPILHEVHHTGDTTKYITAILRPVGGKGQEGDNMNADQVKLIILATEHREANQADINAWTGKSMVGYIQAALNGELWLRQNEIVVHAFDVQAARIKQLEAQGNGEYVAYNGSPLFTKVNGK